MVLSKAEKKRRRAEAAGPHPKPRGPVPRDSNGVKKIWDKFNGGWLQAEPLPTSSWPTSWAPVAAAVPDDSVLINATAAPALEATKVPVQRVAEAVPERPGYERVHLTAQTATPRKRVITTSFIRECTPPRIPVRTCGQDARRWAKNLAAAKRARIRLRPEAHALYCEKERARKRAKKHTCAVL